MGNLETEHLVLREIEEADWAPIHTFAQDPEVVRFLPWGPNTEEQTKAFITRCIADQKSLQRFNYEFAILYEGMVIGGTGLNIMESSPEEADLGYCFNKKYWGRGFASEACLAMIQFGFNVLNLHKILANCDPENLASVRILEKLQFKRHAYVKADLLIRGEWRDSIYFELSRKRNQLD